MSKLNYLAKVLAALILHSYRNYALCFTFRFPFFHSRPMEWSEEHDDFFSERDSSKKCFWNKGRIPASGLTWEAIVDSLNEIHSPKSCTRAVERSPKNVKQKDERGEKASVISVEELTEKGITDRGVS